MIPEGCIERCPGCRYRGLPAEESDLRKQEWASRWLSPLGAGPSPILAPASRWGYRRKALLHARFEAGAWRFGLLKRKGRETELIPIPACPLHGPGVNEALAAMARVAPAELPLCFAQVSGKILTLVLKCHASDRWRAWARGQEASLREQGIEGFQLNWNPSAGRRAFSSRHQEIVFGDRFVSDEGVLHGALSFRQQIPALEEKAASLAEEFLASFGASAVVDLYCGVGATLARWERRGWRTAGLELSGEAVAAARQNAPAALVLQGRAEQRIPQLREWLAGQNSRFVLFTNPPRDGHAKEITEWILEAAPAGIAYLSCNPRTLARDLELLAPAYRAHVVQPFDFFPQTDHVECLALLSRSLV